jgi:hypothetical protein
MPCLYAVRCNFARADLEEAWNDWYSGPKLRQMIAKPLFLSGQRFAASGLDRRRKYLALWVVESPAAFATPEYTGDWGFFEWQPHIRDWSRDLYAAPDDASTRFAADGTTSLHLVSFDGQPPAAAAALRQRVAGRRPGVTWLEAVGLDRHSPILGLARLPRGALPAALGIDGVQETVFDPISSCARAATAQAGADPTRI